MRRLLFLGVLFLTGCTTAPVTGLMDCFAPSRPGKDGDYPPRPVERPPQKDPMPDRLPPPEVSRPAPDVPPPARESADERILPP